MTYSVLRFAHLIGLMLMGAGLIGVWISDLHSRKVRDLVRLQKPFTISRSSMMESLCPVP